MSLNEVGLAPVAASGAASGSSSPRRRSCSAGLVALGAITAGYGHLRFCHSRAAALLANRATEEASRLVRPVAVAERAGERLEAVIAGVPDPVIALDRNGRVLTLNERARSLAPALRQGEPVSLALRMPELIEAIGRAYASGEEQRVEYSERVPLDRWFEMIVKPVRREPKLRPARSGADDIPRSHAAAARGGDAGRFRRQRQPRTAHAARRPFRLHRDLARVGAGRRQSPRALPSHHAGTGAAHGAADRRSAVAVAHRAQCASPPRHAGRSRSDRPPSRGRIGNAWRAIAA